MPLVPNFTAASSIIPNIVIITDSSTGSDVLVAQRRITFSKADNTTLVPLGTVTSYVPFPLGSGTINVNLLDKDYSLLIRLDWLDVSNNVLYTKSLLTGFTNYGESFDYVLTQSISGNPNLLSDKYFWDDKTKLRTLIDSGNQALVLAADQQSAQQCYDLATFLRINSRYFFNTTN